MTSYLNFHKFSIYINHVLTSLIAIFTAFGKPQNNLY
jgi:hypothetical protein